MLNSIAAKSLFAASSIFARRAFTSTFGLDEISLPKLKRKVKSYGAEIIYEYKEMKGIAVRIFRGKSIEQGRKYFESIKGVTKVTKDSKVELH